MSFVGAQIRTPLGNLQIVVNDKGRGLTQPLLDVFEFQPTLPFGMSVVACYAAVLRLPSVTEDAQVEVVATLHPEEPIRSGAETGQGLEAQSWSGARHLLLIGTEDAEFLAARLPNQVRVSNDSYDYEPLRFAMNLTQLKGCAPVDVHLFVAWNEYPERQDCSCWYAVDQSHEAVASAMLANQSLNRAPHGAAPSCIISFLPSGASPLRAG